MDEFIESIVKTILEKWDTLSTDEKDKIRSELINTFISFVGEGRQYNKKIIGIHLN